MPSAARSVSVTEAVAAAVAAIGLAGATAMPRCTVAGRKLAQAVAAWEYHIASLGLRLFETRRKKAHAAMVKAGVVPDHEADPEPVGTDRVCYAGPVVEIRLTVAAPIEVFSLPGFMADLSASKLDAAALRSVRRMVAKHTYESRPAHSFRASLVTR
jgi:hypothetical protein